MTRRQSYDVVYAADPRLQGGITKSIVEEITAHASAGYRTALLPLASSLPTTRPIDQSLRQIVDEGMVDLVLPDQPLRCGLLLARGAEVFLEPQTVRPDVRSDHSLLVVNSFPSDPAQQQGTWDPTEIAASADELFGTNWTWAPLSEVVRQVLAERYPSLPVARENWANVIDLDEWRAPRSAVSREPVRAGRHSRDHPDKWPDDLETLLAAYPPDRALTFEMMGGTRTLGRLLAGRDIPENWRLRDFDALPVRQFLSGIDFFVYFHHTRWVEAFGRAPLEALASGAITVLPEYLRDVFDDAALYATPRTSAELLRALSTDRGTVEAQRELAWERVHERFSCASHVERVASYIGKPRSSPPAPGRSEADHAEPSGTAPHRPRRGEAPTPRARRVLCVTDNGHGLGHVTRLMAIARRLPPTVQPIFLTLSEAHAKVAESGWPVEYFPSRDRMGLRTQQWNELFRQRLLTTVRDRNVDCLLIDHVSPSPALRDVAAEYPKVRSVWSRRGLWKSGHYPPAMAMADAFDLVIEPLDLAAPLDAGPTPTMSESIIHVDPITLHDRSQLLDAAEARRQLGLDPDRPAALVHVNADSEADLESLIERIRDSLRSLADVQVFAPLHALRGRLTALDGVTMRPVYPLAPYLPAFDLAVAAPGYNSFHELVMARVPTVFVPRTTSSRDDQDRRAEAAALGGFGWCVAEPDPIELERALSLALDERERQRVIAAMEAVYPGNGAPAAAEAVTDLMAERAGARHDA